MIVNGVTFDHTNQLRRRGDLKTRQPVPKNGLDPVRVLPKRDRDSGGRRGRG